MAASISFTIGDLILDDPANAPIDAFEAALLDASTGESLLGGSGLSRNDAFLNLQGNGTAYKAQQVTAIDNADGSRTVVVDLTGIPAGTVVNLSFDLLGFGLGAAATNSQATISQLALTAENPITDDPTEPTESVEPTQPTQPSGQGDQEWP